MLDQSFSPENLVRLVTVRDLMRFNLRGGRAQSLQIATELAEKIAAGNYQFSPFYRKVANGKSIYTASTIQDQLVMHKLNDNLRRLYKVRQANRDAITRQVKSLLEEAVPTTILRTDVSGFYENISGDKILSFLGESHLLSPKSKALLSSFFSSPEMISIGGLPRGISLSATFSEIYMRRFDRAVKEIDGVYYYARFVDDIIVFDFKNGAEILDKVERCLPEGLSLNSDKTDVKKVVSCRSSPTCKKNKCKCEYRDAPYLGIEYLGYLYSFPDIAGKSSVKKSPRPVDVRIAKSKINKLKARIIKAVLDHSKNRNFNLLVSRFKYLTGSRILHVGGGKKSRLKTGVFYNYRLLTGYDDLKNLDEFARKSITARRGWLGSKLVGKLTATDCKRMFEISFEGAYKKRITHSFKPLELSLIKRCWKK